MLLAVDIGNTNIVFGCVDDDDNIILSERISTNHSATSAEYAVLMKNILEMNGFGVKNITDAVMSSVVPSVTNTLKEAVRKLNSGSLKGKEKKDAKEIVDDWNATSAAINKEFNERFVNTLKKKLK